MRVFLSAFRVYRVFLGCGGFWRAGLGGSNVSSVKVRVAVSKART